jgi:hypothetical protein
MTTSQVRSHDVDLIMPMQKMAAEQRLEMPFSTTRLAKIGVRIQAWQKFLP